jgi:hypothetical protein
MVQSRRFYDVSFASAIHNTGLLTSSWNYGDILPISANGRAIIRITESAAFGADLVSRTGAPEAIRTADANPDFPPPDSGKYSPQ